MQYEQDNGRVNHQSPRLKVECFAKRDQQAGAQIHGVAHPLIQAMGNELTRRVKGSRGAMPVADEFQADPDHGRQPGQNKEQGHALPDAEGRKAQRFAAGQDQPRQQNICNSGHCNEQ
ncbi:hypothetical protein SDC9_151517 [bioreactor metagenome]|uniref:Uncharacterized protein n=1 Tax=bioreactor metagenome TaxID=1076179 RepID=A0A645EQI4_9ZZZZ